MEVDFNQNFIKRLKQREAEAFTELYRETGTMIYKYILYRVNRDTAIAEDIHSEVYCDAIDHVSSLTFTHNLKAWLFRIARSKIANHFRQLCRENKYRSFTPLENLELSSEPDSPEFQLLVKEHKLLINVVLMKMDDHYRELLQKKYLAGQSTEELATAHGKSLKSIESLLYRAKKLFINELSRLSREHIYAKRAEA